MIASANVQVLSYTIVRSSLATPAISDKFLLRQIGSHMYSIEWWHCRWPSVTL